MYYAHSAQRKSGVSRSCVSQHLLYSCASFKTNIQFLISVKLTPLTMLWFVCVCVRACVCVRYLERVCVRHHLPLSKATCHVIYYCYLLTCFYKN